MRLPGLPRAPVCDSSTVRNLLCLQDSPLAFSGQWLCEVVVLAWFSNTLGCSPGAGEGTQESDLGPQCLVVSGNPHSSLSRLSPILQMRILRHTYIRIIKNHFQTLLSMPRTWDPTGTLLCRANGHSTDPSPCQESIQSPGARRMACQFRLWKLRQ